MVNWKMLNLAFAAGIMATTLVNIAITTMQTESRVIAPGCLSDRLQTIHLRGKPMETFMIQRGVDCVVVHSH